MHFYAKKNRKYTVEFEQEVAEDIVNNKLSYREIERKYEINNAVLKLGDICPTKRLT